MKTLVRYLTTRSKTTFPCFILLLSLLLSLLNPRFTLAAGLTGRTSVQAQITSATSPTITGTLPSWCSDIIVGIGTTQAIVNGDVDFFFSDYGQVSVSNGNWSLNLAANNYGLIPSVYDVYVASECGYSGSYQDPLYEDLHFGAISIIPAWCDSYCVPVYRFYNVKNGAHFYTTTENEKRDVLDYADYRYEGIVSYAKDYRTILPGMIPVYRFYNYRQGVHFYTANQAEFVNVYNNMLDTFRYEGIAYQTYATPQENTVPVHRFYKFKQGIHFYTSNQAEATNVNNTMYNTYRYEGIAYYNISY